MTRPDPETARRIIAQADANRAARVFAAELGNLETILALIASGQGDPVALGREALKLVDRMRGEK